MPIRADALTGVAEAATVGVMFASKTTALVGVVVVLVASASTARAGDGTEWVWPANGAVLRPFVLGSDPYAAGQHRGVDIALVGTEPIRAPVAGEVTFAGRVPTHGLTVTVRTATGDKASLTHLGPLLVRSGARVREGDPVAEPGPSGEVEHDLPYVHLGVRVGAAETYVDPLTLLPPRGAAPPPPVPAAAPATTPVTTAPAPPTASPPAASPPPATGTPGPPASPPVAQAEATARPCVDQRHRKRARGGRHLLFQDIPGPVQDNLEPDDERMRC